MIETKLEINDKIGYFLFKKGIIDTDVLEKALNAKKEQVWGGGNQYLELSNYLKPIESYYKSFDKKNIHLMIFEEWTRDKDKAMRDLFDFLGVDKGFDINHDIKHNEKVAYKNIRTLNLLRSKYIKNLIDTFLYSGAKEKHI